MLPPQRVEARSEFGKLSSIVTGTMSPTATSVDVTMGRVKPGGLARHLTRQPPCPFDQNIRLATDHRGLNFALLPRQYGLQTLQTIVGLGRIDQCTLGSRRSGTG